MRVEMEKKGKETKWKQERKKKEMENKEKGNVQSGAPDGTVCSSSPDCSQPSSLSTHNPDGSFPAGNP